MAGMGGQAVVQHRIGQDERVALFSGKAGQFGQAALFLGQLGENLGPALRPAVCGQAQAAIPISQRSLLNEGSDHRSLRSAENFRHQPLSSTNDIHEK